MTVEDKEKFALLDQFATAALTGLASQVRAGTGEFTSLEMAKVAYDLAEDMLKARTVSQKNVTGGKKPSKPSMTMA